MTTLPLRTPDAVGENVTLMVHDEPGASVVPQLLLATKSPLDAIPSIVSSALPELLKVMLCAAEVVPRFCVEYVRLLVDSDTAGLCNSTVIALEPELAIAMSNLPSPLKSSTAMPAGEAFAG